MKKLNLLLTAVLLMWGMNAMAVDAPTTQSFTDVEQGTPEQETITVTNNQGEEIRLRTLFLLRNDKGFSINGSSTCAAGGTIPDTSSCTIVIDYDPDATADTAVSDFVRLQYERTTSLTLGAHRVFLTATEVTSSGPDSGVDKTTLDFGFLRVGVPRSDVRTMSLTLTNTGNGASVTAVSTSFSGDTSSIFSILSNSCNSGLLPGASCRILVRAEPDAANNPPAGAYAATLTLNGLGDGSGSETIDLDANIENILEPEVTYPIQLTRDEGETLKYTAQSPAGQVQIVDVFDAANASQRASLETDGLVLPGDTQGTATYCKDETGNDKTCGTIIRFIPTANPSAVYEIKVKHPLNTGS